MEEGCSFVDIAPKITALANKLRTESNLRQTASTEYCKQIIELTNSAYDRTGKNYEERLGVLRCVLQAVCLTSGELEHTISQWEMLKSLFTMCVKVILNFQWQTMPSGNEKKLGFQTAVKNVCRCFPDFTQFTQLNSLMDTAWNDPILMRLMTDGDDLDEDEEIETRDYIVKQDASMLRIRIQVMMDESCDDFAVNLCSWCVLHTDLAHDMYVVTTLLVLLHKLHPHKLSEACKRISPDFAIRILRELEKNPSSRALCVQLSQLFLVHDWVQSTDHLNTPELLELWVRHQYASDASDDQFTQSVWSIAKLCRNTQQLGMLTDCLKKEGWLNSTLQLYCDISIYALNVDKGYLDSVDDNGENGESRIKLAESGLVNTCSRIVSLFDGVNRGIQQAAALTAFSLDPSTINYAKVEKMFFENNNVSTNSSEVVAKPGCICHMRIRNNQPSVCKCSHFTNIGRGENVENAGSRTNPLVVHDSRTLLSKQQGAYVDPARLYELDRLLGLLRPWYMNTSLSWEQISSLCAEYSERKTISGEREESVRNELNSFESGKQEQVKIDDDTAVSRDLFLAKMLPLQKLVYGKPKYKKRGRPPKVPAVDQPEWITNCVEEVIKKVSAAKVTGDSVDYHDDEDTDDYDDYDKKKRKDNDDSSTSSSSSSSDSGTSSSPQQSQDDGSPEESRSLQSESQNEVATSQVSQLPPESQPPDLSAGKMYRTKMKCLFCQRVFDNLQMLNRHKKTHLTDGESHVPTCMMFECVFCSSYHYTIDSFQQHIAECLAKLYEQKVRHTCKCGQQFHTVYSLRQHTVACVLSTKPKGTSTDADRQIIAAEALQTMANKTRSPKVILESGKNNENNSSGLRIVTDSQHDVDLKCRQCKVVFHGFSSFTEHKPMCDKASSLAVAGNATKPVFCPACRCWCDNQIMYDIHKTKCVMQGQVTSPSVGQNNSANSDNNTNMPSNFSSAFHPQGDNISNIYSNIPSSQTIPLDIASNFNPAVAMYTEHASAILGLPAGNTQESVMVKQLHGDDLNVEQRKPQIVTKNALLTSVVSNNISSSGRVSASNVNQQNVKSFQSDATDSVTQPAALKTGDLHWGCTCQLCHIDFSDNRRFVEHLAVKHLYAGKIIQTTKFKSTFQCKYCQAVFDTAPQCLAHFQMHESLIIAEMQRLLSHSNQPLLAQKKSGPISKLQVKRVSVNIPNPKNVVPTTMPRLSSNVPRISILPSYSSSSVGRKIPNTTSVTSALLPKSSVLARESVHDYVSNILNTQTCIQKKAPPFKRTMSKNATPKNLNTPKRASCISIAPTPNTLSTPRVYPMSNLRNISPNVISSYGSVPLPKSTSHNQQVQLGSIQIPQTQVPGNHIQKPHMSTPQSVQTIPKVIKILPQTVTRVQNLEKCISNAVLSLPNTPKSLTSENPITTSESDNYAMHSVSVLKTSISREKNRCTNQSVQNVKSITLLQPKTTQPTKPKVVPDTGFMKVFSKFLTQRPMDNSSPQPDAQNTAYNGQSPVNPSNTTLNVDPANKPHNTIPKASYLINTLSSTVSNVSHQINKPSITVANVSHHINKPSITVANVSHHINKPGITIAKVSHKIIKPSITVANVSHQINKPSITAANSCHLVNNSRPTFPKGHQVNKPRNVAPGSCKLNKPRNTIPNVCHPVNNLHKTVPRARHRVNKPHYSIPNNSFPDNKPHHSIPNVSYPVSVPCNSQENQPQVQLPSFAETRWGSVTSGLTTTSNVVTPSLMINSLTTDMQAVVQPAEPHQINDDQGTIKSTNLPKEFSELAVCEKMTVDDAIANVKDCNFTSPTGNCSITSSPTITVGDSKLSDVKNCAVVSDVCGLASNHIESAYNTSNVSQLSGSASPNQCSPIENQDYHIQSDSSEPQIQKNGMLDGQTIEYNEEPSKLGGDVEVISISDDSETEVLQDEPFSNVTNVLSPCKSNDDTADMQPYIKLFDCLRPGNSKQLQLNLNPVIDLSRLPKLPRSLRLSMDKDIHLKTLIIPIQNILRGVDVHQLKVFHTIDMVTQKLIKFHVPSNFDRAITKQKQKILGFNDQHQKSFVLEKPIDGLAVEITKTCVSQGTSAQNTFSSSMEDEKYNHRSSFVQEGICNSKEVAELLDDIVFKVSIMTAKSQRRNVTQGMELSSMLNISAGEAQPPMKRNHCFENGVEMEVGMQKQSLCEYNNRLNKPSKDVTEIRENGSECDTEVVDSVTSDAGHLENICKPRYNALPSEVEDMNVDDSNFVGIQSVSEQDINDASFPTKYPNTETFSLLDFCSDVLTELSRENGPCRFNSEDHVGHVELSSTETGSDCNVLSEEAVCLNTLSKQLDALVHELPPMNTNEINTHIDPELCSTFNSKCECEQGQNEEIDYEPVQNVDECVEHENGHNEEVIYHKVLNEEINVERQNEEFENDLEHNLASEFEQGYFEEVEHEKGHTEAFEYGKGLHEEIKHESGRHGEVKSEREHNEVHECQPGHKENLDSDLGHTGGFECLLGHNQELECEKGLKKELECETEQKEELVGKTAHKEHGSELRPKEKLKCDTWHSEKVECEPGQKREVEYEQEQHEELVYDSGQNETLDCKQGHNEQLHSKPGFNEEVKYEPHLITHVDLKHSVKGISNLMKFKELDDKLELNIELNSHSNDQVKFQSGNIDEVHCTDNVVCELRCQVEHRDDEPRDNGLLQFHSGNTELESQADPNYVAELGHIENVQSELIDKDDLECECENYVPAGIVNEQDQDCNTAVVEYGKRNIGTSECKSENTVEFEASGNKCSMQSGPVLTETVGCEQGPVSVECEQVPVSVECEQVPVSVECEQVPVSVECEQVPVSVECEQVPVSVECEQVPVSVECEQVPVSVECEQVPVSVECEQIPVSVECEQVPVSVECERGPVTLECERGSVECEFRPFSIECEHRPVSVECDCRPAAVEFEPGLVSGKCDCGPMSVKCEPELLTEECDRRPVSLECEQGPVTVECEMSYSDSLATNAILKRNLVWGQSEYESDIYILMSDLLDILDEAFVESQQLSLMNGNEEARVLHLGAVGSTRGRNRTVSESKEGNSEIMSIISEVNHTGNGPVLNSIIEDVLSEVEKREHYELLSHLHESMLDQSDCGIVGQLQNPRMAKNSFCESNDQTTISSDNERLGTGVGDELGNLSEDLPNFLHRRYTQSLDKRLSQGSFKLGKRKSSRPLKYLESDWEVDIPKRVSLSPQKSAVNIQSQSNYKTDICPNVRNEVEKTSKSVILTINSGKTAEGKNLPIPAVGNGNDIKCTKSNKVHSDVGITELVDAESKVDPLDVQDTTSDIQEEAKDGIAATVSSLGIDIADISRRDFADGDGVSFDESINIPACAAATSDNFEHVKCKRHFKNDTLDEAAVSNSHATECKTSPKHVPNIDKYQTLVEECPFVDSLIQESTVNLILEPEKIISKNYVAAENLSVYNENFNNAQENIVSPFAVGNIDSVESKDLFSVEDPIQENIEYSQILENSTCATLLTEFPECELTSIVKSTCDTTTSLSGDYDMKNLSNYENIFESIGSINEALQPENSPTASSGCLSKEDDKTNADVFDDTFQDGNPDYFYLEDISVSDKIAMPEEIIKSEYDSSSIDSVGEREPFDGMHIAVEHSFWPENSDGDSIGLTNRNGTEISNEAIAFKSQTEYNDVTRVVEMTKKTLQAALPRFNTHETFRWDDSDEELNPGHVDSLSEPTNGETHVIHEKTAVGLIEDKNKSVKRQKEMNNIEKKPCPQFIMFDPGLGLRPKPLEESSKRKIIFGPKDSSEAINMHAKRKRYMTIKRDPPKEAGLQTCIKNNRRLAAHTSSSVKLPGNAISNTIIQQTCSLDSSGGSPTGKSSDPISFAMHVKIDPDKNSDMKDSINTKALDKLPKNSQCSTAPSAETASTSCKTVITEVKQSSNGTPKRVTAKRRYSDYFICNTDNIIDSGNDRTLRNTTKESTLSTINVSQRMNPKTMQQSTKQFSKVSHDPPSSSVSRLLRSSMSPLTSKMRSDSICSSHSTEANTTNMSRNRIKLTGNNSSGVGTTLHGRKPALRCSPRRPTPSTGDGLRTSQRTSSGTRTSRVTRASDRHRVLSDSENLIVVRPTRHVVNTLQYKKDLSLNRRSSKVQCIYSQRKLMASLESVRFQRRK